MSTWNINNKTQLIFQPKCQKWFQPQIFVCFLLFSIERKTSLCLTQINIKSNEFCRLTVKQKHPTEKDPFTILCSFACCIAIGVNGTALTLVDVVMMDVVMMLSLQALSDPFLTPSGVLRPPSEIWIGLDWTGEEFVCSDLLAAVKLMWRYVKIGRIQRKAATVKNNPLANVIFLNVLFFFDLLCFQHNKLCRVFSFCICMLHMSE